jgi:hypothetical protein
VCSAVSVLYPTTTFHSYRGTLEEFQTDSGYSSFVDNMTHNLCMMNPKNRYETKAVKSDAGKPAAAANEAKEAEAGVTIATTKEEVPNTNDQYRFVNAIGAFVAHYQTESRNLLGGVLDFAYTMAATEGVKSHTLTSPNGRGLPPGYNPERIGGVETRGHYSGDFERGANLIVNIAGDDLGTHIANLINNVIIENAKVNVRYTNDHEVADFEYFNDDKAEAVRLAEHIGMVDQVNGVFNQIQAPYMKKKQAPAQPQP